MKLSRNVMKVSILIVAGSFVGLFQNCGQRMMFQVGSDFQKTAALVPIVDSNEGSQGGSGIIDENSQPPVNPPAGSPPSVQPPTSTPPTTQPSTTPPQHGAPGNGLPEAGDEDSANSDQPTTSPGNDGSKGNQGQSGNQGGNSGTPQSSSERQSFACILEGPGQSVRVGLVNNALAGQNAVPQSVCMSRKACLDIASTKLPVKEAVEKGYCANNPNVIHLSDEQVSQLVD